MCQMLLHSDKWDSCGSFCQTRTTSVVSLFHSPGPEGPGDLLHGAQSIPYSVDRMIALEDHGTPKITVIATIVITITANVKDTFLNFPFKLPKQ